MKAIEFEVGKFYSRRNYDYGLTVRLNKQGKYGYFSKGTLVNMVSETSSVHNLNDFFESDKNGCTLSKKGTPFKMYMDESEKALHGASTIELNKEDKMARFDNDSTVANIATDVKDETVDVAQITIGKLLYTNGVELIGRVVPQLTWYEKLFTSSKKRELAVLIGTYIAIKAIQTKYNHYTLSSISAYINFQLQTELLGGVSQNTLDKLFTKLESQGA